MDKAKSKRVITIVLIISAVLGLAAIATAYYYYQIRDVTPQEGNANLEEGCGCYFVIASDEINSCADATPKNAFAFKPGIIENDVCTAECDTRSAPELRQLSQSTTFDILSCRLETFSSNPGCLDISIEDSEGKRIGDSIFPEDSITLNAKFNIPEILSSPDQEYYESYYFVVNGSKIDADKDSAEVSGGGTDREFSISTQITDYEDADTLTVQAFADSISGNTVTSEACLRELPIVKSRTASCTDITFDISLDSEDKVSIDEIAVEASRINVEENPIQSLAIKFTVGSAETELTTKDLVDMILDEEDPTILIFDKDFLYDSDNFTGENNFSVLDDEQSSLDIKAEIILNGEAIDSDACLASEEIPDRTPTDTTDDDTDVDKDDTDDDDSDTDEDDDTETSDTDETGETSNFTVTKEASLQCVEREDGSNSLDYTITIKNEDTTYEDITSIKDKLPLGFTYTEESTTINSEAVTDSEYVTVTDVGNSQEIVWQAEDGWSVNSDDTLEIKFSAVVTENALTGDNLNEVIVTPLNTPADDETLRTEVSVEVSQNCNESETVPDTAIFDNTVAKLVLGISVLILGGLFYYTNSGNSITEKLMYSGPAVKVYRTFRLFGLKPTDPRKYFEEKTVEEIERKKKD